MSYQFDSYKSYNKNKFDMNGIYKFMIFISFILVIASIITFSLFLKNIYTNMDEIREQEIKFRNNIADNTICCEFNRAMLTDIINERDKQKQK